MLHDLRLLTRIQEGDVKAFEEIFRCFYAPLCIYATCVTGCEYTGEEIVQDLFYVIWRDRQKLQLFSSWKSYLFGAVRKESLQYLEHEEVKKRYDCLIKKSSREIFDADPEEKLELQELERLVGNVLQSVPSRRREIFVMHRDRGMKYSEIANFMQISVKTVEAEMTKVLKELKKNVEYYYNH